MGKVIKGYGKNYSFEDNASLKEVREWLKNGESLITHGWFTGSGHVICIDGLSIDETTLSYKLSVKDPWGEFNAKEWQYIAGTEYFDGWYSSYCIYASCVASSSVSHAKYLYNRGELNSSREGMWVHRITP
jgi:aminopeptidase C